MLRICLLLLLSMATHAQADDTLLGAGVRSRPDYDGASSRTVDLIPVVRYYGEPWFARTTQGILEGGARLKIGTGLEGGLQLAYEQGPLDKDPGASLGVHLEWDSRLGPAPTTLLGRWRQYLDADRGMQFDLRGTIGVVQSSAAKAGVFVQFTFADAENMRAYYGRSDSGHLYTDLGMLGSYDLSRKWVAVGSLHFRRLSDNAGNVQKRSGTYASAGVAYKF